MLRSHTFSLLLAFTWCVAGLACSSNDGAGVTPIGEEDASAATDVELDGGEATDDDADGPGGSLDDVGDEATADAVVATCWTGIQICEGDGVKTCVDGAWSEIVPCVSGECVEGFCTDCTPDCANTSCGPDGCGGSCGECAGGGACDAGQCPDCVPECTDLECGSDGCGGSCGFCDVGLACADGSCSCSPSCAGKECGPDDCGGQCGICLGDFACSELGECLPSAYRAVLIQGHWNAGMDCSQYNSTGADIDAIELRGVDGELVGYLAEVLAEVGTDECQNNYTDPELSIGEPDGDYMALQGGWIMGRFADYVPVTSGMTLVIHEAYSAEPYSIYLATGFDCAESDDPGTCSMLVTDEGNGSMEIEIP
jgi:hypothetical protein